MKKNSALIPARVAVPMGPHTRAHGHRHAGPDKIQTIFAKDTKENKMLL